MNVLQSSSFKLKKKKRLLIFYLLDCLSDALSVDQDCCLESLKKTGKKIHYTNLKLKTIQTTTDKLTLRTNISAVELTVTSAYTFLMRPNKMRRLNH